MEGLGATGIACETTRQASRQGDSRFRRINSLVGRRPHRHGWWLWNGIIIAIPSAIAACWPCRHGACGGACGRHCGRHLLAEFSWWWWSTLNTHTYNDASWHYALDYTLFQSKPCIRRHCWSNCSIVSIHSIKMLAM